jgi:hypothetical protein
MHDANVAPPDQGRRMSNPIGGKTRAECAAATLQILQGTRLDLVLYSRDLDPAVLNTTLFLEAFRQLALRRGASVRILLQSTHRAMTDGHRLIELSRRLPSSFTFRCPQTQDLLYPGAFLVNDQFGFLARSQGDRYDCEGDEYDIPESARLKRYFDEVWERSRPASELRRLSL